MHMIIDSNALSVVKLNETNKNNMFQSSTSNSQLAVSAQRKGVSTMRRLTHALGTLMIGATLAMPAPVLAATAGLGSSTLPQPSNISDRPFLDLLSSIINWILGLVGTVAVLMLIWGGFNYLTSAGNSDQTKKAKQTITYAVVGIIIIALAYTLVNFITGTIAGLS